MSGKSETLNQELSEFLSQEQTATPLDNLTRGSSSSFSEKRPIPNESEVSDFPLKLIHLSL